MKNMKKLCTVLVCSAMAVSAFGCSSKTDNTKSGKSNDESETTTEATEAVADNTTAGEDDPEAPYRPHQLFIDDMSKQEFFDLCHATMSVPVVDGEYGSDYCNRLPFNETGITPNGYGAGASSIEIEYYGAVYEEQRNYLAEIDVFCDVDYDTGAVNIADPEEHNGLIRSTTIYVNFVDNSGREWFDFFKEQYSALYPDVTINESSNDANGWITFSFKCTDGHCCEVVYFNNTEKNQLRINEYDKVVE